MTLTRKELVSYYQQMHKHVRGNDIICPNHLTNEQIADNIIELVHEQSDKALKYFLTFNNNPV